MVCTETYHLEMLLQESVSSTLNLANKLLIIRPQKKKGRQKYDRYTSHVNIKY